MENNKECLSAGFDFKNPPAMYGEVSFFWWHGDDITREKLSWILEQLKEMHICGLQINYCHGNKGGRLYGLTMESNPKPFSENWWELIQWFTNECKKYGMTVSLSDYTLGSPGQECYMDWVLEKHPEMIGQRLVLNSDGNVEIEKVPFTGNPMAIGFGEAIAEEFYGAFEQRMPGECGNGLNFFFSDELNFNIRGNLWCDDFKEEFEKRKGYDITENWKAIFEDIGPQTPKIRLDYYDVIVQLSEERYFKVIYNWHEDRGMIFGCDHGGRGTDITEFGDYFRTMKWNQGPGNDQPRLSSNIIKSKVSASIAHMYQRPRVWLEGFYSSGWGTSSADVADATFRNFALGHNLLSLHGLYYSTHGSMWEWAPPCNHHHMPYWRTMEAFLACTERLSYFLSQGFHCCDVAIVYPVATAEADVFKGKLAAETAFHTARHLYAHGIDFDFIDFESIERAEVSDGELHISGESFKTIIIPAMEAVRYHMMERLLEFSQKGGCVIFQGCLPNCSDRAGREDAVLDELVQSILETGFLLESSEEIVNEIKQDYILDFSCDSIRPFFHHRKIEGKDYYFVYRVPEQTGLRFRAKGYPVILNPWDGSGKRLENYVTVTEYVAGKAFDVTEIQMPLTDREVFLIMFEPDKQEWCAFSSYEPFNEKDNLIQMHGEWESQLIPTMDNTYGDWRLPAFAGYISAEGREFDYCYSDSSEYFKEDKAWERSIYSYGTYFWVNEGAVDETALIEAETPPEGMRPYRFSMKSGVQGDAGPQNSYHGLKGCISDEFLVMGKKRLTHASSDSVYEGEGPYYFYTTIFLENEKELFMETGEYKPDKLWIDHREVALGKILLSEGRHYILLRFPQGGRSYFVMRQTENPVFVQTIPLAMTWYQNPDIVMFDALPKESGRYCWYRFMAPPGAVSMKIRATRTMKAFVDGNELVSVKENEFLLTNAKESKQVLLCVQQNIGEYDTAIILEPVTFETAGGRINVDESLEEQGLGFYSGGILYKKKFVLSLDDRRYFFEANKNIGCAMEIIVNGKKMADLLTNPYRCEISEYLCDGENEIQVISYNTLYSHMRTIPTNYNCPIDVDVATLSSF